MCRTWDVSQRTQRKCRNGRVNICESSPLNGDKEKCQCHCHCFSLIMLGRTEFARQSTAPSSPPTTRDACLGWMRAFFEAGFLLFYAHHHLRRQDILGGVCVCVLDGKRKAGAYCFTNDCSHPSCQRGGDRARALSVQKRDWWVYLRRLAD